MGGQDTPNAAAGVKVATSADDPLAVHERANPLQGGDAKPRGPLGQPGCQPEVHIMSKAPKFLTAVAVAGIVAISGSAFTAGNTVPDSVAGYGTSTVSGATATAVEHTLAADGATITSSTITFNASQEGNTVKAAFGSAALEDCTLAVDFLSATCTYSTGYDTATASAFNVAVS